ncbi:MAG: DNA recombination protein RmuC [Muribaculaceae bacterium]|nr:DNA recombination protein RmuC [Muribaculaceae bacterium]
MTIVLLIISIILCIVVVVLLFYFRAQISRISQESERNFKLMASESLERNARNIQQSNADQLQSILTPLKMRIEDFNREISKSNTNSEASRRSLSDQIERLTHLNLTIGEEARSLASALRGNNRVQGLWGETILQTLLERAGLKKGVNFDTQVTRDASGSAMRDEDGRAIRPDLIIYLPDSRNLVVDSKTSLSAYLDICDAANEQDSADAVKRHIASVRKHIDELAARNYPKTVENAAEQVLMFIPNDGALIAAVDNDNSLVTYALDRKIVLVSPSQILGLIMLVAQIWRKDAQDKNAAEIARLGGLLYDSAKDFLSDLEGIDKSLNAARRSYESALSRLTNGSRSLMNRAERLRELGAKTSRRP